MSNNQKRQLPRVEITFPDCSFNPDELAYAARSLKRGNNDDIYHLCNLVKMEITDDPEQASRLVGARVLEKIQLGLGGEDSLAKWVYYNGWRGDILSVYNLLGLDLRKLWLHCHRKGKFKVAVTVTPWESCKVRFLFSSIRYLE